MFPKHIVCERKVAKQGNPTMSGKVTRKTAPQMPTGMTHSRTNEVTIVDFLYEESLGSKESYVSFSTIVLTKDLARI